MALRIDPNAPKKKTFWLAVLVPLAALFPDVQQFITDNPELATSIGAVLAAIFGYAIKAK